MLTAMHCLLLLTYLLTYVWLTGWELEWHAGVRNINSCYWQWPCFSFQASRWMAGMYVWEFYSLTYCRKLLFNLNL